MIRALAQAFDVTLLRPRLRYAYFKHLEGRVRRIRSGLTGKRRGDYSNEGLKSPRARK